MSPHEQNEPDVEQEDFEEHLPDVCEAFELSNQGQFIQDHNLNSEPLHYYFENDLC